jgi:hypothetical protein
MEIFLPSPSGEGGLRSETDEGEGGIRSETDEGQCGRATIGWADSLSVLGG